MFQLKSSIFQEDFLVFKPDLHGSLPTENHKISLPKSLKIIVQRKTRQHFLAHLILVTAHQDEDFCGYFTGRKRSTENLRRPANVTGGSQVCTVFPAHVTAISLWGEAGTHYFSQAHRGERHQQVNKQNQVTQWSVWSLVITSGQQQIQTWKTHLPARKSYSTSTR